jgi:hypothetical protein
MTPSQGRCRTDPISRVKILSVQISSRDLILSGPINIVSIRVRLFTKMVPGFGSVLIMTINAASIKFLVN